MAVEQFARVAEGLRASMPEYPVEYGYLEFANPIIKDGLDKLRAQGVNRVLAVPGMLFAAGHAKNDIPSVLNAWAASHPDMEVLYGAELGLDGSGGHLSEDLFTGSTMHQSEGRHPRA